MVINLISPIYKLALKLDHFIKNEKNTLFFKEA
jgi:hypothetical protein